MQLIDHVYSSPNGLPLRFDLLAPDMGGPHPLVVCIHGGGWISGDKSDMHEVVSLLASHGYAAAAVSYRLAPLHPFPAAVQDLFAFVRHARENAAELNVDPARVASMGTSAGGHLACMLGVLDNLPGDESPHGAKVQAVIDFCGITDIIDPRGKHLPISWSFVDQFMEVPYEGNEERYRLASPITHVSPDAAPFAIFHGEADDVVPISQSEAFYAALQSCDVPAELHRYPGEGHGFSYEAWPDVVEKSLAFLRRTLRAEVNAAK